MINLALAALALAIRHHFTRAVQRLLAVFRARDKYEGHHSESWLDDQFADDIAEDLPGWSADDLEAGPPATLLRQRIQIGVDLAPAGELVPLPVQHGSYNSHLQPHIDAAWAATGVTQAQWWAQSLPRELPIGATIRDGKTGSRDLDMPAGDRSLKSGSLSPRPPRKDPGAARGAPGLPDDFAAVLPPRVIRALAGARPDQTVVDLLPVIRDDLGGTSVQAVVDYLFSGLEARWAVAA